MFQTTVRSNIAGGVVGDIAFLGPIRAKSYILNSADAANNVIGRVFTETGVEGEAEAGGAGAFAGILFNSKTLPSYGTVDGTLEPTLTLANGQQAELLQMGELFVALDAVASSGDVLSYDTTTGEIIVGAPGVGQLAIPTGKVSYFNATAPGFLAVAKITD